MRIPLLGSWAGLMLLCSAATAADPQAANTAALSDAACSTLRGGFYWEIGDAKQRLVYGEIGRRYRADTDLAIASASKFVWGAYVLEDPAQPTVESSQALRMLSGYSQLNPLRCLRSKTVQSCLAAGSNGERKAADVGAFFYNGGHDQQLAVELGLGALDAEALGVELRRRIGPELAFRYQHPQPAGGLRASPATYAGFLRKLLRGELRLAGLLGREAVCTTAAQCPNAHYSPGLPGWTYSYNHWVEQDGSFSSAGLEGFYPWISADKRYYGLVAREKLTRHAAMESARCGAAIRRAFLSSAAAP